MRRRCTRGLGLLGFRDVGVRVVGEARVRFHVGSCVGFFRISF